MAKGEGLAILLGPAVRPARKAAAGAEESVSAADLAIEDALKRMKLGDQKSAQQALRAAIEVCVAEYLNPTEDADDSSEE